MEATEALPTLVSHRPEGYRNVHQTSRSTRGLDIRAIPLERRARQHNGMEHYSAQRNIGRSFLIVPIRAAANSTRTICKSRANPGGKAIPQAGHWPGKLALEVFAVQDTVILLRDLAGLK